MFSTYKHENGPQDVLFFCVPSAVFSSFQSSNFAISKLFSSSKSSRTFFRFKCRNKSLEKQAKLSENISNSFGVRKFQGISDLVKDIPLIGKLSEPFAKAADAAREVELKNATLEQFQNLRKEGKGITEALSQTGLTAGDISKGPMNSLTAGFKSLSKFAGGLALTALLVSINKVNKED